MFRYLTTLLLLLFLINGNIFADKNKHFNSSAAPSKLDLKEGEKFIVRLNIELHKTWYTYSMKEIIGPDGIGPTPTEISIEKNPYFIMDGKIIAPKPKIKYDSSFFTNIETYKGNLKFDIPVKSLKDFSFKNIKSNVILYLQQCDPTKCLPPEEYKIPVGMEVFSSDTSFEETVAIDSPVAQTIDSFQVKTATINKNIKNNNSQTESTIEIQSKKSQGLLVFMLWAMLMGAGALLTPCVFPMVPITVSFFTKRAEKHRGRGLRDSIIYALGIISTFTAIGFIISLIFGPTAIQNFATNPWLNIGIAILFVVFALNLFGAFEIQIPTGLLNFLNRKSQGSGIGSVWLMGLTFSLTSFTCTVPFVGNSLFAVSQGEWFYPIVGMLGFSTVFALPFFLLALFPSAMNKMPKAGGWMNNVKVVMGFLEIAFAIKFISNADLVWMLGIMPREMFLGIWIGCGILITLYILGIYKLTHDSNVERVGSLRLIWSIFFISVTFYLLSGFSGKPLGELDAFLPPPNYNEIISNSPTDNTNQANLVSTGKNSVSAHDNWISDYNEALKIAQKEKKPIFIDFTGVTCTNCRWMELNMFPKPSISNLMNQMVKVRLFTDRRGNSNDEKNKQMQQSRYNSIELPLYVILTPDEKLIATKAFTRDENEFKTFLERGIKEVITASN